MRAKLPLLRNRNIAPARAPVLRYGVAVLSIILALIPAFLLSDVVESRLVVFAVAIMVSAWYGGWKPGLVATSFALTVSAYFSLAGAHTPSDYRRAIIHLALFVFVAGLICSFNAALRSAQEGLRRSEINFRSLVTHAPYGVCRCDSAGILLDVNPALVAMLGYASGAELVGSNLANLYADSQQWFGLADYLRSLQKFHGLDADWAAQGPQHHQRAPLRTRLPQRSQHHLLRTVCRGRHRAPRPGTATPPGPEDGSRRPAGRRHRPRLQQPADGDLGILRVPAGAHRRRSRPCADHAQEIANAAERATSLTRQLLAFSRKQMLAPKIVDLNSVVTENVKMLTRLIGEDIDLVMVPGPDIGAVKADPGQIEQVIMNLAVNARDAMPHGGKLTIETANVTLDANYARFHAPVKPGDYVMLAISDTGMGMDADTQAHIFEPFYTTKGLKGTGLGLSTVYGIVKQSEGYIWLYSEAGKGTSFKIYLPRFSATGEALATQPALAADADQPSPGHETILLVEDEENLRRLARQSLETQGYSVIDAPDGAAAIKISQAHKGPIHLLLTDVIMPGMNGRELANQLSPTRPEMRVLYMSGYTENHIGHNGTLDEGITLLQKPFTLPALKAKVREVLDTPLPQEIQMSARLAQPAPMARTRNKISSPFRATRFDLHLPLKYRLVGESGWREGTTENISRSGMLFQAEEPIPPNAQLEINLVLPAEIAGLAAAEVVCRGEVVRAVKTEAGTVSPTLAAKILQYHFQHGSHLSQA